MATSTVVVINEQRKDCAGDREAAGQRLVQGGAGMAEYISLTEYIQSVCLPAAGQALVDGKICTVTGWGNTQYYGESCPLPGKPPLGRLTQAGEGQSGGLSACWPWGVGSLRSLGWALQGKEDVHAPQLWPALPTHP